MLKDVSIIILDEATADVDTENEDRLQKAIEALARNKTITMIARRKEAVEANRTIKAAAPVREIPGGAAVYRKGETQRNARFIDWGDPYLV